VLKRKIKANGTPAEQATPSADTPQTIATDSTLGSGQLLAQDVLSLDIYWMDTSGSKHYGKNGDYSNLPIAYISICCKRQNVTTLRQTNVSNYDEVVYGLDQVFLVNR
jgi:hypothetical protein